MGGLTEIRRVFTNSNVSKGCTQAKEAHMAGAYPMTSFCSMKQLKVLDGMLVHRRVTPSSMSPVPIFRVSCLSKNKTMEGTGR